MKRCVLCKSTATIYCESDMASLCWTCDAKVHSANFLVARHSRSLLCQICHSQTLWSSSGEKLCSSTTAVCGTCDVIIAEGVGGNGDEIDYHQVVAWLPPPLSSSSSEEVSLKRNRHMVADYYNSHQDEIDSSSATVNHYNYKPSSTMGTVGNRKKLCERSIKSKRTLDLDLNLPAIE